VSSHATFLQAAGQDEADVDSIGVGDAASADLEDCERALLEYVRVLTLEPAKVRDAHVESLRAAGWNDEEIFEASFITALFAFFNRMADAYGLDYPEGRWVPPDIRDKRPPGQPS
jgi:uncharacterized peroxidase-related enzyme